MQIVNHCFVDGQFKSQQSNKLSKLHFAQTILCSSNNTNREDDHEDNKVVDIHTDLE